MNKYISIFLMWKWLYWGHRSFSDGGCADSKCMPWSFHGNKIQ